MFYNCHIHTFTAEDIPDYFLPLKFIRFLAKRKNKAIDWILRNLNPFSDRDVLDRYAKFITIGKIGSQQKIYEECRKYYPLETRFVVLPMDMANMGAGNVPRDYAKQLEELALLKNTYPQIIPFVHIDPRRNGIFYLLQKCVEQWGFKGVKFYPSLGYFPYDEALYPIYEYCQRNKLPIISHCSPYNPVHFKGSHKELYLLLSKSRTPIDAPRNNRKELCANFTNPENWKIVLNDFSELRVCLAHFGSEFYWKKYLDEPNSLVNWFVTIKEMLPIYNNLYTDVSFTLNNRELFPLLKILLSDIRLKNKILFGSDFYMVETTTDERRFGLDLRAFIGETNFMTIAYDNPIKFLQ